MIRAKTKVVAVAIENLERTDMMFRKSVRIRNSCKWEDLRVGVAKNDFQLYHFDNMVMPLIWME